MNTMLNTAAYYNPQLFMAQKNPLAMPLAYQNMAALVNELQSLVIKQQSIISTLSNKVQQYDLQEAFLRSKPILKKMDSGRISDTDSGDATSETTEESFSGVMEPVMQNRDAQIRRRNGFKNSKQLIRTKSEEDIDEDYNPDQTLFSKTSSTNQKFNNSSKAKHLWVNYGRRILEYAIHETDGPLQERVKLLVGKLNSKKDFEKAFQAQESDSEDEKEFKKVLGKLALHFVRNKASPTFESSKYKQEMISQRHTVAAWIERLLGI